MDAKFAGAENLRLVVNDTHVSPAGARVCLSCGAVLLTATEPGALRVGAADEQNVQEFDF